MKSNNGYKKYYKKIKKHFDNLCTKDIKDHAQVLDIDNLEISIYKILIGYQKLIDMYDSRTGYRRTKKIIELAGHARKVIYKEDKITDLLYLCNKVEHVIVKEVEKLPYTADGKMNIEENILTILIPDNLSLEQRNFRIAHEIGHYFLHMKPEINEFTDSVFYREGTTSQFNKMQYEANEFAGCLLMPEDKFRQEFLSKNGHLQNIAKVFGVLTAHAHYRAKILRLL